MHDDHAGHSVAAIHQRGRSLQDFYRPYTLTVNLNAVLVAPLLTFLTHAVAHHNNTVVA